MKGIPKQKLLVGGLGYAKQRSVGKFLDNGLCVTELATFLADIVKIPLFALFFTSQVVSRISSINSMIRFRKMCIASFHFPKTSTWNLIFVILENEAQQDFQGFM